MTKGRVRRQGGRQGGPQQEGRSALPWTHSCRSIQDALTRGDDVVFTGFGKFSAQKRAARTGVNPRNPEPEGSDPRREVPKFSAGSGLKQAVRG